MERKRKEREREREREDEGTTPKTDAAPDQIFSAVSRRYAPLLSVPLGTWLNVSPQGEEWW